MADTNKIITVTGPVEPDPALYFQCHEHLLLEKGKSFEVDPALCLDDLEKSVEEAKEYAACGGDGLVEAQPVGCGRQAEGLKEIARRTGLRIVASTGFHKMAFYPEGHWIFSESEEWLTDLFCRELLQGMYVDCDRQRPEHQTEIRAGQIKTAMDQTKISDHYRKLFLAAAHAAGQTGAPIMVHVENGHQPLEYFDLLTREGIPAVQMIFCHLDRACQDLGIHRELARAGAYLEYDTIARFKYHSDEKELEIFDRMINWGYQDRLLFSLDTTRKRLSSYGGETGLTYILTVFLKKMRDAGFSGELIDQISRKNPAVALCWK